MPCGIMFHHFHGNGYGASQGSIDADTLEQIIRHLGRNNIIPAEDWLFRASEGELGERDICLTFDDALRCQYDIALPVLESIGLTAFWFVYSSVFEGKLEKFEIYRHFRHEYFQDVRDFYENFFAQVEKSEYKNIVNAGLAAFSPQTYMPAYEYLSAEDKKFRYVRDRMLSPRQYEDVMDTMLSRVDVDVIKVSQSLWLNESNLQTLSANGHVIGLHSYSHPMVMTNLTPEEQFGEYARNKNHLRKILGVEPLSMSHPCNSYDKTTLEILDQLGIKIGFRANMEIQNGGKYEFPRRNHATILRRPN